MLLRQIVEINPKGSLRSSVNFDMMRDKKDNLALCEEFIFNYDKDKPTESTVGVLDALRSSFDGRGYANIHLMIQMYGKGKSHFAVAIANYFKQSAESAEVRAILGNIDNASGSNSPIAERLHAFKKRGKHLVICLSGEKGGNLKKQFLEAVLHTLEQENGITGTVAQRFCANPLKFLEELTKSEDDRAIAEAFLENHPTYNVSLQQLIRYLRDNKYEYVKLVKDLSCQFTKGGFPLDFETDLDVQVILQDLIDTLCTGEDRRFLGILILFDELNRYLRDWSSASTEAGGAILQNITNICENNKGRIALMSFAQYRPIEALINPREEDSYFQIASRLEPPDTTYRPASSLELVLDTLIIQRKGTSEWQNFEKRFESQLLRETQTAYDHRIRSYREKGIDRNWFHTHITVGCFPLHPLTAYLLCNLDFAQIQDRTAIGFLRGRVRSFIETQPVEKENEQLNCIHAVDLIDEFGENFSNHSVYAKYKEAEGLVIGSDDPDELTVLKGLLLYYANKERLVKSDTEEHREILANLTGLPRNRVEAALKRLMQVRDVIYYKAEEKSYRFHIGLSPTQVEQDLEQRIREQVRYISANDVVNYCLQRIDNQPRITQYLGSSVLAAKHFIDTNKLIAEEWRFEQKVYTIKGLEAELTKPQAATKERGILAYVVAETQQELQDLRHRIDQLLAQSPIRQQIAVAIPTEETGNLAEVLLKIRTLRAIGSGERSTFGAAYESLLERYEEEVNTRLTRLLKAENCTFYSVESHQIPQSERSNPKRVISALLQSLYHSVPPMGDVQAIPQMKSGHQTGATVIGLVARHLLTNTLNTRIFEKQEYKTVVNQIFVHSWRLLQLSSQQYSIHEPANANIRAAWNVISQMTELGEQRERSIKLAEIWKTLSAPPYGYNEHAFSILLAGWLGYHSKEVVLRGKSPASKTASPVNKSLKDWAGTDGFLAKAKPFVSDWIVRDGASLIRRQQSVPKLPSPPIDYDQATKYIQDVSEYLETAPELEPTETADLKQRKKQVKAGVEQIDNWLKPIAQLEKQIHTDPLLPLLQGYPHLLQLPEITSDELAVYPTQEQRDRQSQVRQAISNRIEALIPQYCDRLKSLTTETDCLDYQQQTEQIIEQLNADEIFPIHWREPLQTSLQAIALRVAALKKQEAVTERLTLIQAAKNRLTSNSTQQDYASVRHEIQQRISEIEALIGEVLAIDSTISPINAKAIYQPILESVIDGQNSLIQQIEGFQQRLTTLKNTEEIQRFQTGLVEKSFQYRGSPDEERYKAIYAESTLLLRLFEIAEAGRADTISACDTEINRLNKWKEDKTQELTPLVQARLENLFRELEQAKSEIQEQQRIDATKWLADLEREEQSLAQITDSYKREQRGREILNKIRDDANKYAPSLTVAQKQAQKRIRDSCNVIKNQQIEGQIVDQFKQLPRHRKIKLLVTLNNLLDSPTEESHDG
jgi:hypothetical protein